MAPAAPEPDPEPTLEPTEEAQTTSEDASGGGVGFSIDYVPEGPHGLEVTVMVYLEGEVRKNDGNVVRAAPLAVDTHSEYDLIVVQRYDAEEHISDNALKIEAWYIPENVEEFDLENPDQTDPYEHCYSC